MRRLFTLILFTLLVLPFVAFAQDQKIGWNLQDDNYVDVQDLGFRFYYPTGWAIDTSNGITMGQTQADIDAQTDDDDSTQASGMVIGIKGFPIAGLTADLGDNPSLDKIVDFAVKSSGITEESRTESAAMTRRAISVIGKDSAGREGFATFWKQGEYAVIVTLGLPEKVTVKEMEFTWGVTLDSIKPLDAQDLGDGVLTDDVSHFTINYPADWSPDPKQAAVVYELADDVGKGISAVKGNVFTFSDAALSDLQLKDDATLDDVIEKVKAAFNLDDTAASEEFVLLGQPAVTLNGEPTADSGGAGHGLIVTAGLVDGRAIVFILVAPSKDAADTFLPTWIQMLQSVKPTETAS